MIPLATTTVTIRRRAGTGDPYEVDTATTAARKVTAHISAPGGSQLVAGGAQEDVQAVAYLPTLPTVGYTDELVDDVTGDTWTVTWVRQRRGLGLGHQIVGLRAVEGAVSGG